MNKSTFEEELNRTGSLIYTNCGDSMLPLIREKRDLLIIKKVKRPLKKYEVPLYRRDSGEYVLHRIIKIGKRGYEICGDNRWRKEYGITDQHILGVLDTIVRDGKSISVTDWKYRVYMHVWCDFFYIRAGILIVYKLWKKIWRT